MISNIFLGPDADVRFALSRLRAHETTGRITHNEVNIVPGITLSHGPGGKIKGSYSSGPNNMIALSMTSKTATSPEWQCLTVSMGPMDLTGAAVIGVAARTSSPQSTLSRVILRSGRGNDYIDISFIKAIASFSEPSTHIDVIEISNFPNLPLQSEWRDMIIFFRPGPLEIDIIDFRFFVM